AMPTEFAQFTTTRVIVPDDNEDDKEDEDENVQDDAISHSMTSEAPPNHMEEFAPAVNVLRETPIEQRPIRLDKPAWQLFNSAHEFKLARWIVSNRLTTKAINAM